MSTPGGARRRPEARIRTLAQRALALRRAGKLDRASSLVGQGFVLLQPLVDLDPLRWRPLHAELVALDEGIAIDGGRFDGVIERIDVALAALPALPAARLATARLHFEAGRAHAMLRRLPLARERLLLALDPQDGVTLEGEPAALILVRADAILGAALCMHGDHARGLERLRGALERIESIGYAPAAADHARILINLGAVHFEQHRLQVARRCIEQAQALLAPLVRARRAGARADLGRSWANLGSIQSDAGRFEDAVDAFRAAIGAYDQALRTSTLAGDVARLRASRANATMNLGYAMFRAADFDAAQRHLSRALRRYEPLRTQYPHLRADAARALVNAAHLAFQRGKLARAAALYARGRAEFESMIEADGAAHLAADHSNASLGLARVELAQGRATASASRFELALATLRDLTHQGELHLATAWLQAWVAQATLLLDQSRLEKAAPQALPALLRAARSPPRRALGEQEEPLRAPAAALDAVEGWMATASRSAVHRDAMQTLSAACLTYLLDCTAQVLMDSSPTWLASQQAAMQGWVARLGEACLSHPRAEDLLAQWFLATRGLRAQRIALAVGSDERVQSLHRTLQQLHRLESDLLGHGRARTSDAGRDSDDALLEPAAAVAASSGLAQRAANWRALHDEVEQRIARAVRDGLLPEASRLSATALTPWLRPNSALLLVARLDNRRLVVVAVRAGANGGRSLQQRIVDLSPQQAELRCDQIVGAARESLRYDHAAGPARDAAGPALRPLDLAAVEPRVSADRLARTALRVLADAAVATTLQALAHAGCHEVDVVPADDLHFMPWGELAREWQTRRVTLAVYPSAGAWLRCASRRATTARSLPTWAIATAAGSVGEQTLRWVEVERRLSTRLWCEAGVRVARLSADPDGSDGASALLVIGHATVPDGNPALAGLHLDSQHVLGAHEAAARGMFERVVLSACVLGRTEDAFGEPLGFLSACFAYHARFGVGWLTEVPDDAACLFGLALQFALRESMRRPSGQVRWNEVFHITCRSIEQGAWPDGFAAWVGQDPLAGSGTLPAAPPPALRRVLPWVVALGE